MIYRIGNHNPALVYGEHDDAEFFTPPLGAELVAVFVRQGGEHELDALHYVRAMNATMPRCTCRVICCCGALIGTTSGCETCMEHNGECIGADLGELNEDDPYAAREASVPFNLNVLRGLLIGTDLPRDVREAGLLAVERIAAQMPPVDVVQLPRTPPEVIDGIADLVGRDGDRYEYRPGGVFEAINPRPGWRGCLGHVLEREGGSVCIVRYADEVDA